VKEDSISRQSSIGSIQIWLDSLTICKRAVSAVNRVLDLFRYGGIHLHTVIVKEGSISRQSSIRSIQIWFDLLTYCNSKGGQYQSSIEY
jgi:hypothetical protein